MNSVIIFGVFWTVYGAAGLLGFQIIPEKYKGHDWTKGYIHRRGASWIMLGVPWLVLCMISYGRDMSKTAVMFLLLVLAIPALGYAFFLERKYKALLRGNGGLP